VPSSPPQLRYGRSGKPGGKGSDSRQKGRIHIKVAEVKGLLGVIGKEERRERSKQRTIRRSYTLQKRRPARIYALPDTAVAVSIYRLAVWSFTFI
jgi:hypothetical protein